MLKDYLLRLSSHEPACLHTSSRILSKPVGPVGGDMLSTTFSMNDFGIRTNIGQEKFILLADQHISPEELFVQRQNIQLVNLRGGQDITIDQPNAG